MQTETDGDQPCECRLCGQPMKLIRRLPKMGPAPELLVFYCRDCNEIDSAHWRQSPLRHGMALN
jgi:hypothetical protein